MKFTDQMAGAAFTALDDRGFRAHDISISDYEAMFLAMLAASTENEVPELKAQLQLAKKLLSQTLAALNPRNHLATNIRDFIAGIQPIHEHHDYALLAEVPEIHEALGIFGRDPTGENGVEAVKAVAERLWK